MKWCVMLTTLLSLSVIWKTSTLLACTQATLSLFVLLKLLLTKSINSSATRLSKSFANWRSKVVVTCNMHSTLTRSTTTSSRWTLAWAVRLLLLLKPAVTLSLALVLKSPLASASTKSKLLTLLLRSNLLSTMWLLKLLVSHSTSSLLLKTLSALKWRLRVRWWA